MESQGDILECLSGKAVDSEMFISNKMEQRVSIRTEHGETLMSTPDLWETLV